MIKVYSSSNWNHTEDFLRRMLSRAYLIDLEKYAAQGVSALRSATPDRDGDTSQLWSYEIINKPGYFSIKWRNSDAVEPGHIPVVVLIQYGHGTRNGGYVQGLDFINPAMRPIFEQITADMWREVTR
jgi:hypothetical protein